MSAEIRPSFALELDCPSKLVLQRMYARLGEGPHQVRRTRSWGGRPVDGKEKDHFVLTVSDAEQRLWSPWLDVEVTPRNGGTHLFARFGPNPGVWTWFAMTYVGLTLVFLMSLCWALALVLGRMGSPWTLWVSAAAAVVMALLWAASQVGQRWGRAQMVALRAALEASLAECGEARVAEEMADAALGPRFHACSRGGVTSSGCGVTARRSSFTFRDSVPETLAKGTRGLSGP